MNLSKYKHIIWDWNGTLFDDAWLCVEVMNGMLQRRGLPLLTAERYREIFDFPVSDYYRRLGFDFEQESFEKLGTEFIVEYEKRRLECRLQEHALNALKAAEKTEITQSVLSAYKQNTLEELVDHFDLRRYFLKLIGLNNHYANGKIGNAQQWIEELNYGPHEVALIGDTVHDYEVAETIGTDCVLIISGHHPREKLASCGAPVLDSLAGIEI